MSLGPRRLNKLELWRIFLKMGTLEQMALRLKFDLLLCRNYMKICAIHITKKFVFIFREQKLLGDEYAILVPMFKLERPKITAAAIGNAVMDAIGAPGVLKERVDFKKILTESTGFKSWGVFANATEHHCLVVAGQDKVEVKPSVRDGRSFVGDNERIVTCQVTAESVGQAIFEIFFSETLSN